MIRISNHWLIARLQISAKYSFFQEVYIDTVFIGDSPNWDLQALVKATEGKFFYNPLNDLTALMQSFKELAADNDGDLYNQNMQVSTLFRDT